MPPASMAQLKGNPVLLFFWAHWCVDCKGEAPTISRLRSKLAPYPHSAKCLVSVRGQGYMFSERGGET